MAIRRLYSMCVVTMTPAGRKGTGMMAFTVARNEEQLDEITRQHVGPDKRFSIDQVGIGSDRPEAARDEATVLDRLEHVWMDPKPGEHSQLPVPGRVFQIMTRDAAL